MADKMPWVVECDDPPKDCPGFQGKCWTGYLSYGLPGFDTEDSVKGFPTPEKALEGLLTLPGQWSERCRIRKRKKT